MVQCQDCGADWSEGKWTPGCKQCGGGAMTIPCPICDGLCGKHWQRAVADSWDFGQAHWFGSCGLPQAEQNAIMRRRAMPPDDDSQ